MRAIGWVTAAAVVVGAVCWVAGCAKKSEPEAVPETRDMFTDKRDGKTYKTVKIGELTWMAENLNYKPESGNSWCYDDICAKYADSAKYGRLYDSAAAKTVCPTGWHLPSRAEWDTLARFVGGTKGYSNESYKHYWANAVKYLMSQTGWNYHSDSYVGTDAYGFSALPGGYHDSDGSFHNTGLNSYWWTATDGSEGEAYFRYIYYRYGFLGEDNNGKDFGFSVRCVGDTD